MGQKRIAVLAGTLPLEAPETEGYLIASDVNRYYLTGFSSTAGMVLVTAKGSYLLVDFRYFEAAVKQVDDCRVMQFDHLAETLDALIKRHHLKNIMVEQENTSLAQLESLKNALPGVNFVNSPILDQELRAMRAVKSEKEMESLKKAQKITEDAFSYILPRLVPGRTEAEIALDIEMFMRQNGAERTAFDLIVVSGRKSSMPHGVPGENRLKRGDFVTMDTGAVVDGMHSDMTRTVAVGEASAEKRKIYEIVLQAQKAAIAKAQEGVKCADVDRAAREVIEQAGYGKYFGHSTGHSVGLEIHESPNFSPSSKDTAKSGMVITVEPGIYLPGRFGVRIEDMVYITPEECENLTHCPKELIIV